MRLPSLRRPQLGAKNGAQDAFDAVVAPDAPLENQPDGRLMELVKAGDDEAFRVLVDRYRHALVNYMTRLCRDRDRAEEYAQETFVRIWKVAERYEEKGQFAGYLFRIATNLLRSDERRSKRWRELRPTYVASQGPHVPSPQGDLLSSEASRRTAAAIADLPMRYRAPLVLREIEGWSYRQIAEFLECREGTVKSRINRAKGRLRDLLESYWEESKS